MCVRGNWAAQFNTWLLIKLTPEGLVFSFFFFLLFLFAGSITVGVQEEVSVLPGWGTWANQQKEPHWVKAANQKAQRSVKKDSPSEYLGRAELWLKETLQPSSRVLLFTSSAHSDRLFF